eukprot:scaffold7698_cov109-Cylindrotheca_fusiformis.AAC.3
MTSRKNRDPDDVHDIWNVEIGKPYRGQIVEKIDMETTTLDSGKVKIRRLIHLDNRIILIEDTYHEYGEVYVDGKHLPYNEIQFPHMEDPGPMGGGGSGGGKDDEDEEAKKKKREILRQKAKQMLGKRDGNTPAPAPAATTSSPPRTGRTPEEPSSNSTMPALANEGSPDIDDDITVFIRTPDGSKHPIKINPEANVADLKKKIKRDHDIPIADQNLVFADEPLDDPDATLKDCGIQPGDTIDLVSKKTTSDKPAPPAKANLNDDAITVRVRTPEGKKHRIQVDPTDSVEDLKKNIENELGIPTRDQDLSYRGKPLNDPSSTMDDCGIKHGDIVDLDSNGMSIIVRTPEGKQLTIPVNADDTIRKLKNRIKEKHGVPVEDHKLSFDGTPLDDPESSLDDYGLSNGDTIDLEPADQDSITVIVRSPAGDEYPITVQKSDRIQDIKKALRKDHGIPEKEQTLSYKGHHLDDPNAKVDSCGIRDGDVIDLLSKKEKTPRHPPTKTPTKRGKERVRTLGPNSAWVYPSVKCAPKEGEKGNLQGVWATPPGKEAGTEPVEVKIHPRDKEPVSDGKTVHGLYGYVNGAKPDADGVVDPANIVFYPPDGKPDRPDFEMVGFWSSPNSSKEVTISWRFEGADMLHVKKTTVSFMGTEMTFTSEYTK